MRYIIKQNGLNIGEITTKYQIDKNMKFFSYEEITFDNYKTIEFKIDTSNKKYYVNFRSLKDTKSINKTLYIDTCKNFICIPLELCLYMNREIFNKYKIVLLDIKTMTYYNLKYRELNNGIQFLSPIRAEVLYKDDEASVIKDTFNEISIIDMKEI